ncbi:hypothetical protein C9374_011076 [Naegleria lovaniensis]|uniref:Protein kinase domain-containing protein n=1 Tax=Naegleria lovaniensis TaxID=51637 RepID=A0AA88KF45_NAELO|nr:uncharacterized protein C9374_011076 [Naegleria lovaniensis]KAG2374239.1 hypothetical protein C9374_011076 [Naegleria lovaniensis]
MSSTTPSSLVFRGIVLNFLNPLNNEHQKLLLGRKIMINSDHHLMELVRDKLNEVGTLSGVQFDLSGALFEYENPNNRESYLRYHSLDDIAAFTDKPIQIKISSISVMKKQEKVILESDHHAPSNSSDVVDQSMSGLTQRLTLCANDEFSEYSEQSEDNAVYDTESLENNALSIQRVSRWNGRYEPRNVVGSGGFGQVYLCNEYAFNGTHKGTVAVKLIPLLGSVEDFNKKIKEAILMLKLRHENLVPALDIFEIYNRDTLENSLGIVTPFYINGDLMKQLNSQIEKKECLPEEIIYSIMKDLLTALNYLHTDVGIAHRDIKPANIFLEKINLQKKTVKAVIGDFGVAREMPNSDMSLNGTMCGSPLFVSPEVILGKYNLKCDLYSLGVVLYQMLSLDLESNLIKTCFSKFPLTSLMEASNASIIKDFTDPMIMRNYAKETTTLKRLKEMMYLMLTYNYKKRPSAKYFLEQLEKKGIRKLFGFKN